MDPLHQDLLQVRVVLAVDLILNLPAQAIRRTFVSHADSLTGGQEMEEGAWREKMSEKVEGDEVEIMGKV